LATTSTAPAARASCGLAAFGGQRTEDDNRHRAVFHDLLQEGDAVHAGHFDVENQHVRFEIDDFIAGDIGVRGGADDFDARLGVEFFAEDLTHDRRVVHDEHFMKLSCNCHGNFLKSLFRCRWL
jgi:hypothetical protein